MSYHILSKYAERCGWTEEVQVDVLCEYVSNQQSDDAFEDFLKVKYEEYLADDNLLCRKCGSNVDTKGYCVDETCPYSDLPQEVELVDLYRNSRDVIEKKYGVKKRREE